MTLCELATAKYHLPPLEFLFILFFSPSHEEGGEINEETQSICVGFPALSQDSSHP